MPARSRPSSPATLSCDALLRRSPATLSCDLGQTCRNSSTRGDGTFGVSGAVEVGLRFSRRRAALGTLFPALLPSQRSQVKIVVGSQEDVDAASGRRVRVQDLLART